MKARKCVDRGREGCPCALAAEGSCIACSRLSGGTCNDCRWQGVCIYLLYRQKGGKPERHRERELPVMEIREYSSVFSVWVLDADYGFCQKAGEKGAYVFLRRPEDSVWYDTPISILKAEPEKGRIHLGISAVGVKSRRLIEERTAFHVRGIFYNGMEHFDSLIEEPEKTLIYGKGIAIAPLRNLLDQPLRYGRYLRKLRLFYDPDRTGADFFYEYFGDLAVEKAELCDFKTNIPFFGGDRMNLFALTSPYYADELEKHYGQKVVRPAPGNFCCGEGICGACTYNDARGNTVHRCKCRE